MKSQGPEGETDHQPGTASPGVRVTPEGQSSDEQTETSASETKAPAADQLLRQTAVTNSKPSTGDGKRMTSSKKQSETFDRDRKLISTQAVVHADVASMEKRSPDCLSLPPASEGSRSSPDHLLLSRVNSDVQCETRTTTPSEVYRELDIQSTMPANKNVLQSHSETCLSHRSCKRGEKQNLWKKAFVMISKERRIIKRMKYLEAYAPEMAAQIRREHKKGDIAVLSSTNSKTLDQRRNTWTENMGDNAPANTCSPAIEAARPFATAVQSKTKRKDTFDKLCEKYSRHKGEAVRLPSSGQKGSGFLPLIETQYLSTPSASRSSGDSFGISSVRSAPHSEGSTNRGVDLQNDVIVPSADSTDPDADPQPRRTHPHFTPTLASCRPLSLPVTLQRHPKLRRRFGRRSARFVHCQTSKRMEERILDIQRIYASDWIQRMKEQMRRRIEEIKAEVENADNR